MSEVKEPMFKVSEKSVWMRKDVYDELEKKAAREGKTPETLIFEIVRPVAGVSTEELVEIKLRLPKNVLSFLKDMKTLTDLDLDEYVRECVIKSLRADVDTMPDDTPFWDLKTLKAKYQLEEVEET